MLIVSLAVALEKTKFRKFIPTLKLGGGGRALFSKVLVKLFRQQYWWQGRLWHSDDGFCKSCDDDLEGEGWELSEKNKLCLP